MKRARNEPKVTFKVRDGFRLKAADAEVLGPILYDLARRNGVARAEDLLSVARDPSNPAHKYFEWDDAKAAEEYRLGQARYLSRAIIVQTVEIKQDVRALQYVDSQKGYVPSGVVFADADMTHEVLERAKREALAWYHRYQQVRAMAGLAPVFDAIEAAFVAPTEDAAQ